MMRWLLALVFLVPFTAYAACPQGVIAAEYAFSDRAMDQGIKTAFLANLADDSVVFDPLPVNGHDLYAKRPETQTRLRWYPVVAAESASGELAYSTGPWEARTAGETSKVYHGRFASVWRRDDAGCWEVAVDAGSSAAEGTMQPEPGLDRDARPVVSSHGRSGPKLDDLEDRVLKLVSQSGAAALRELGTRDLQLLVAETGPRERIRARSGGGRSRADDLAYLYGTWRTADKAQPGGGWLQVWRRDGAGAWRLVLWRED